MESHDDVVLAKVIPKSKSEVSFTFDRRQFEIWSPVSNFQCHNRTFFRKFARLFYFSVHILPLTEIRAANPRILRQARTSTETLEFTIL